jgi:hypothetical protein
MEIELKATLKIRKLLILLNGRNVTKHTIRPTEVHAGHTST